MREVDIARHVQATQPHLERPAAYAFWLAMQLPGARLDLLEARLMAEVTEPDAPGSFRVVSIRLAGRLQVEDPEVLGQALLRGAGRRRAYGLGMVVIG
jgi:hypothetical protein